MANIATIHREEIIDEVNLPTISRADALAAFKAETKIAVDAYKKVVKKIKKALYNKHNAHKVNYASAKRRAIERAATPEWSDEFLMTEIYDLARLRTQATGVMWHVDHIVPLNSKRVCGLHVENNLRVVTAKENIEKNNYHWPDM